jgi:hypothetical protein
MKLLDDPTIISVVGVALVEDVVTTSSTLVALGAVSAVVLLLGLWWLGLRQRRLRQIVHEEPPLFSLGIPVGDLEEPNHRSQLIVHGQLLLHIEVGDTHGEHRDDVLVGDPRDFVPHLAEGLDVLSESLTLVLTHHLEVIFHGRALVRGHEIGDELPERSLPRVDRLVRKVHETSLRCILEGHEEPVGLDALISMSGLDCDDVELEELDGLEDPL